MTQENKTELKKQQRIEIECPNCKDVGSMVSVERVWQSYPVYCMEDGSLDFEGTVIDTWCANDGDNSIRCDCCATDFSRDSIVEYMKEINMNKKESEINE